MKKIFFVLSIAFLSLTANQLQAEEIKEKFSAAGAVIELA